MIRWYSSCVKRNLAQSLDVGPASNARICGAFKVNRTADIKIGVALSHPLVGHSKQYNFSYSGGVPSIRFWAP